MPTYKILILGASYGSLLATKLLLAGHTVKMVCLPAEADLFNTEGAIVRMPIKGREGLVEIRSRDLPGKLSAGGRKACGSGLHSVSVFGSKLSHTEASVKQLRRPSAFRPGMRFR